MATNKDRIYQIICEKFLTDQVHGVTTLEVAKSIGIKRSNASSLLNDLYKNGLVRKTNSRPVEYLLAEKPDNDPFKDLIGYDGSLRKAIKLAKAGILYPRHSLAINIYGHDGVGISRFVEAIIDFAKEQRLISETTPIIKINCRLEIQDQENLKNLLFRPSKANIFNMEKKVIFLDHYEYLTASQIEQLSFQIHNLMEQGNAIVICSSCDLEKAIDAPVQIDIPSYEQRPLKEKLNLIARFFTVEASNSKHDIAVSRNAIVELALTNFKQNIKELRKNIVVAYASAYARNVDQDQERVFVNSGDLSLNEIDVVNQSRYYDELEEFFNDRNFILFSQDNNEKTWGNNLYNSIDSSYQLLQNSGLSSQAIHSKIQERIAEMFKSFEFQNDKDGNDLEFKIQELTKIVPRELVNLVKNWFVRIVNKQHHEYDSNIFYGVCLHLNSLIFLGIENRIIPDSEISLLKRNYANEFIAVQQLQVALLQAFDFELNASEQATLVMFLVEPEINLGQPVVLYAMHGNGVGKALSEVTNDINQAQNTYYYDMELDKSTNEVFTELKKKLLDINQGGGVIVIYDMGSLKTILDNVVNSVDFPIRLINIPITLVGLETARKALKTSNIDDLYHDVMYNLDQFSSNSVKTKPSLYITLCHTGEGGAMQLKDYIDQYSKLNIETKAMSISNREKLARKVQELRQAYTIKAFIGTYNPNLFGIPYISIDKIFGSSSKYLDSILNFVPVEGDQSVFSKMYDYYQEELVYTPVGKLKEIMPRIMDLFEQQYHLDYSQQVGVFTHIVGLIEGILSGAQRKLDVKLNPGFENDYRYIRKVLNRLEKKFDVIISDQEVYLITNIIKKV